MPQGIRQHFVMSANLRSLLHILLIRGKKDAQLEVQQLCELTLPHLKEWAPQVYDGLKQTYG
jgi:thymidylate synthase (FAD)